MNICWGILFAVVLLEMILFGVDTTLIVLMVAIAVMASLNLFMYFYYPKINYKAMANLKDVHNEYIFTDERLLIDTKHTEYDGKSEIAYSVFVKAYETSRYLFLYQTNRQVFIVDKSTLTGGSIEDIRNTLSPYLNQKYIICNY